MGTIPRRARIIPALTVGLIVAGCGSTAAVDHFSARAACEDMVRQELKAPDTAKFSNEAETGDGPWTSTGAVDSQNSFGADLRSTFTCKDITLNGTQWTASVKIDQP